MKKRHKMTSYIMTTNRFSTINFCFFWNPSGMHFFTHDGATYYWSALHPVSNHDNAAALPHLITLRSEIGGAKISLGKRTDRVTLLLLPSLLLLAARSAATMQKRFDHESNFVTVWTSRIWGIYVWCPHTGREKGSYRRMRSSMRERG